MVRLKKWVKAVSAAGKREAFSTAFAHGLRSKFSSCPSLFSLFSLFSCFCIYVVDIEEVIFLKALATLAALGFQAFFFKAKQAKNYIKSGKKLHEKRKKIFPFLLLFNAFN